MSEEKYNGWTNRETWAVALHINNDQGWQESVREALREADVTQWNEQPNGGMAAYRAGQIIKDNVEEVLAFEGEFSYGDPKGFIDNVLPILNDIGSLWRVNWTELGESFLEDIADIDRNS